MLSIKNKDLSTVPKVTNQKNKKRDNLKEALLLPSNETIKSQYPPSYSFTFNAKNQEQSKFDDSGSESDYDSGNEYGSDFDYDGGSEYSSSEDSDLDYPSYISSKSKLLVGDPDNFCKDEGFYELPKQENHFSYSFFDELKNDLVDCNNAVKTRLSFDDLEISQNETKTNEDVTNLTNRLSSNESFSLESQTYISKRQGLNSNDPDCILDSVEEKINEHYFSLGNSQDINLEAKRIKENEISKSENNQSKANIDLGFNKPIVDDEDAELLDTKNLESSNSFGINDDTTNIDNDDNLVSYNIAEKEKLGFLRLFKENFHQRYFAQLDLDENTSVGTHNITMIKTLAGLIDERDTSQTGNMQRNFYTFSLVVAGNKIITFSNAFNKKEVLNNLERDIEIQHKKFNDQPIPTDKRSFLVRVNREEEKLDYVVTELDSLEERFLAYEDIITHNLINNENEQLSKVDMMLIDYSLKSNLFNHTVNEATNPVILLREIVKKKQAENLSFKGEYDKHLEFLQQEQEARQIQDKKLTEQNGIKKQFQRNEEKRDLSKKEDVAANNDTEQEPSESLVKADTKQDNNKDTDSSFSSTN